MSKVISFYSYKGGTGRTTTCANVAYQLALMNKKVMCIDLDIDGPGLHAVFGLDETLDKISAKNIVEYFKYQDTVDFTNFAHDLNNKFNTKSRFDAIPAIMSINREDALDTMGNTLPDKLETLIQETRECYDYIILDTASGVSDYSALAFAVSDIIIVCFKWSKQHVLGTLRVSKLLKKITISGNYPLTNWMLVPTSVPIAGDNYEIERKKLVIDVVKEKLSKEIPIEILEDSRQKWDENIIEDEDELFIQYRNLANLIVANTDER